LTDEQRAQLQAQYESVGAVDSGESERVGEHILPAPVRGVGGRGYGRCRLNRTCRPADSALTEGAFVFWGD
jgi:hypothetical protein